MTHQGSPRDSQSESLRSRIISLIAAVLLLIGVESVGQNVSYPASTQGGFYTHNYYFGPAPSSTPWAPAWSPDGTKIAVAMSGSLWIVDPSSGSAHELTYTRKYHSMPAWSPDGRWIVYVADDGGQTLQLEIVDVETGHSRPLTSDHQVYMDPAFSPDGTRLAYVATQPTGNFNVFFRAFKDGQLAGDEIAVTRDNDFGRSRLYFGPMDMHIAPVWMPDGKELLLVSNRDVPLGSGNVLRVPAAANGIDQATMVLAEQTLYRTRPDVSLDGKRFIYSSTRGAADQFNNLYVQPTTGGEPYKMTFFQHDAFHPRWSPDGEWIAFISNESGLPQLQLLETYGGALKKIRITERQWQRPTSIVSVRTIDATTGQPTAARIHLKASDGKMYAPEDAYARVTGAGDRIFHQAGTFRVEVPAGPVTIEAVKGFEYTPAKSTVQAVGGKVVQIDLKLQPLTNLSARGWYNGSTHVHMNYAGNLHNTPANLMMMSAAEDQDMVNEQVANKDNRILDYQHFIPGGKPHPISTPDRLLVVGQEYRPAFYGHVFMFQLRDHLISPFTTGYEGTAIESLYPSNTDMLRKAKAQGATVGYVHAFGGSEDPLSANLGGGKGYIVDAALGTTDALEWSYPGTGGFHPWYATLNNGLRVTAVGGEDSISSMQISKLVGSTRTYVHTGDRGLDADAWFEGVRNGRAFVSTGPLVELMVSDHMPGEEVRLPAPGGEVSVVARVQSITPLESVMLVWNGEIVEKIPLSPDRKGAQLTKKFKVARSGWYHLRAEGNPKERYPLDTDFAQAFTNPVWVTVGDQPVRNVAAATYCLDWIDKLQRMAEAWPGWRSQQEKDHVYAQFDEARAVYRKFRDEATATSSQSPRSPRLATLSRALTDGDANAVQAFWREIEAGGAPLIEDHASGSQISEGTMLVTFVVRATGAQDESVPSVYGQFGDTQTPFPVAEPLSRLRGSDVWFRTYEMSDRARFSYHLRRLRAGNDHPQAQASDGAGTHELFLDPLNPKSYPNMWGRKIGSTWAEDRLVRASYAEGPRAQREPFVAERPGVPHGKVTTLDFASKLLGNERKITIYTPPGADRGSPDCDFLLLFDRAAYLTAVPTPTLLDNMLADGLIRPVVAVLVGNTEKPGRGQELPPNPLFQKFLGEELLPWVRARYRYSNDPRRAVVAGSSFGGLAASYTALNHPEVFGNVLSQSGSYWWSPQWQPSDKMLSEDSGWLIRQYGEKARLPVRFYLEAGTWEGPIILQPNRQFHSLLQDKGYDVHYEEPIGGHDYVSWRATLVDGLQRLIGK